MNPKNIPQKLFFASLLFFLPSMSSADSKGIRPWTIQEVVDNASYKEKVLIRGKIIEEPSFDYFLVEDETGKIMVDARDMPKNFRTGDTLFLQGRYTGASSKGGDWKEIEAYRAARPDEEKKTSVLIKKYGFNPEEDLPEEERPEAAKPSSSVTERLQELEDLKKKNLVSDSEYQKLREKILEDL